MTQQLETTDLRRIFDPAELGLENTSQLERLKGIIGQERAVRALKFGLQMSGEGFNVFVSGPPGIGKMTSVKAFLEEVAKDRDTPPDWCYVHNFDDPYEPKALRFAAGSGIEFRSDMENLINYIQDDLLKLFESDSYSSEREDKMKGMQQKREGIFRDLSAQARDEGFELRVTPMGVALIPLKEDGSPMDDDDFRELPEEKQEEIREKQQSLMEQVNDANKKIRKLQREGQDTVKGLDKKVVMNSLGGLVDDLTEKYEGYPDVVDHLKAVQKDVLENIDSLKAQLAPQGGGGGGGDGANVQMLQMRQAQEAQTQQVLRKYKVNVVVNNADRQGSPLVVELNPNYVNLIGRIEKEMQMGALNTDFTMVQAGSLLRAMGGFLILPVDELLRSPYSWTALKRALKSVEVRIEEPGEQFGLMTIKTLRPQPIPLDLKIVLIGSPVLYQLLYAYDADFPELFKVKADYDLRMKAEKENLDRFNRFVCTFCEKEGTKHLDAGGVARLLEYAARLSGHKDRISTNFGSIADVLREANYWASDDGADFIQASHVQTALDEKVYRSRLLQDRIEEMIEQGTILIDVEEEVTGQLNGLSVIALGDYEFGRPNRITAGTTAGRDGIIDIEREAKLGGPIHSKGVLILSGYISAKYADDRPLTLATRVVFEQSYQGVEGDSASAAEVFAILSSLSGVPIRQRIAVTGSVNQKGQMQAVGGINEKIEGYFEVCRSKSLSGTQGVLIPRSNVQNLMLKEEVVRAVEDQKFSIWAVDTIDEGIEVLTGVSAGEPDEHGEYPQDSFNGKVRAKLRRFEEILKEVQPRPESPGSVDDTGAATAAESEE